MYFYLCGQSLLFIHAPDSILRIEQSRLANIGHYASDWFWSKKTAASLITQPLHPFFLNNLFTYQLKLHRSFGRGL